MRVVGEWVMGGSWRWLRARQSGNSKLFYDHSRLLHAWSTHLNTERILAYSRLKVCRLSLLFLVGLREILFIRSTATPAEAAAAAKAATATLAESLAYRTVSSDRSFSDRRSSRTVCFRFSFRRGHYRSKSRLGDLCDFRIKFCAIIAKLSQ